VQLRYAGRHCDSAERESTCQTCWTAGSAVDLLTVKALLTEAALQRVSLAAYRCCADPACEVVYSDAAGRRFTTADVRVPVWQKHPFGDRMVCYCFGEREGAMREEIERTGHSEAAQRVRAHIAAQRCACEVRNPRGTCCLGEVAAAVARVAAAVEQAR
jgi:hypothetical protein